MSDQSNPPANNSLAPGQILPEIATIQEILLTSATVRLPNGAEATLPWKEVWPAFGIHDRGSDYRVITYLHQGQELIRAVPQKPEVADPTGKEIACGDKILVVPCGQLQVFGKQGVQNIVSHCRIDNDPWQEVAQWSDGDLKILRVEFVSGASAWGTIAPGIRARVSLAELDGLLPASWNNHQIPIPGDEIAGWFQKPTVDENARLVTLNYRSFIQSPIRLDQILPQSAKTQVQTAFQISHHENALSLFAKNHQIKTILLLEDDTDILSSLKKYLAETGKITVLSCQNIQEAKKHIDVQGSEIDLALIDVNLTLNSQKDHQGIEVAISLHTQFPKCPIVLTTGEEIDLKHSVFSRTPEASKLQIQSILYKPFGPEALHLALSAVGKPAKLISTLHHTSPIALVPVSDSRAEIRAVLDDACEYLQAEAVVLFRIHSITDEVRIVAKSETKKFHDVKEKLAWSPIRDAAIRHEEIWTNDAPSEFNKHRYLFQAYECRSCVGVPVTSETEDQFAFAVFAFHPKPDRFEKTKSLKHLKYVAKEIALIQKVNRLEQHLKQMHTFAMMGQAYGNLAHDLSQNLSFHFMIHNLDKAITSADILDARAWIQEASERLTKAQEIVRGFRDMARGENSEVTTFAVKPVLNEILEHLKSLAAKFETTLDFDLDIPDDTKLRMRKSQLEQLLSNLVFNAFQQIQRLLETPIRRNEVRINALGSLEQLSLPQGQVRVSAKLETDPQGHPNLLLVIADNGPGIHQRDFEQIFALHYTTKDKGCGLGLDICRKIADDVRYKASQGRVWVQRSILLTGSTFAVRLPLQL